MVRLILTLMLLGSAATADAQWRRSAPDPQRLAAVEQQLDLFTSERLVRFSDEAEFQRYVETIRAAERLRYSAVAVDGLFRRATLQEQEQACLPELPTCEPDDLPAGGAIVVTGSRIRPSNPSITNNQMAGVEEGDIVKQIGQFLIVLQDGRLFVVDTRGGAGRDLIITDRRDVYDDPAQGDWYDEMLVHGDRIVVIGYSYRRQRSELLVFRLDGRGRVAPEGAFEMPASDYYSRSNYAIRIVGDRLVFYNRLDLVDPYVDEQPQVELPVLRRVRPTASGAGQPLFQAADIYRPVRRIIEPTIHSVTICPLGDDGPSLECRSTALIGPYYALFYASASDAFLWTVPGVADSAWPNRTMSDCTSAQQGPVLAASVYRFPIAGGALTIAGAQGSVVDQFALDASDHHLRAITAHVPESCYWSNELGGPPLAFVPIPLSSFSDRLQSVSDDLYVPVPSVRSAYIATRFTGSHVVYGGPPERRDQRYGESVAYAVSLEQPRRVTPLRLPHTVIRAERVGDDIVLTGYADRQGVDISYIDLRGSPRIASTVTLDGRQESESRSHAFNSIVEEDGSGMIGLPTIPRRRDTNRYPWRSRASDISFLTVDRAGGLRDVGRLDARQREDDESRTPGYACEVSCIDWYGNSRPIFTDGRMFGLTGGELVEGAVRGGQVRELRRLDITLPVGARSRSSGR